MHLDIVLAPDLVLEILSVVCQHVPDKVHALLLVPWQTRAELKQLVLAVPDLPVDFLDDLRQETPDVLEQNGRESLDQRFCPQHILRQTRVHGMFREVLLLMLQRFRHAHFILDVLLASVLDAHVPQLQSYILP